MTNATFTPNEAITTTTTLPPPGGGLVAAIANVMSEVHTVAKRGENTFHSYRYATMGDILKEITPLLGRHGIVIFQSETGRAMFDEDNVIAVEYAFTVAHVSGETWPPLRQTGVSACRNTKGGWDDKALNKCHTAARKYFLLALFQIPTGEEDDADQGVSVNFQTRQFAGSGKSVANRPRISERAIAARVSQAWDGSRRTQPFLASEAGNRDVPVEQACAGPTDADPETEARRAAVQLQRSFSKPAYVIEPPKRRLQRELDKQRHAGNQYDAQIRSEQRREGRFRQPLPQQQRVDERFPPPGIHDDADIPGFLDRRGGRR